MFDVHSATEAAGVQLGKPVVLHPDNGSKRGMIEMVAMLNRYRTYSI